jgi:hypothetical protein
VHVPDHCAWEPTHQPGCQLSLPPSKPHVLLSLQTVLCWHLFHLKYSHQDDCKHHNSEQSHLLGELPDIDVSFSAFGCMDDMLLSVINYDQYVAICHPLPYTVLTNPHFCCLSFGVTLFSLLKSQLHNLIALQLTFFKGVEISNYICDPSQPLNLSCSESFRNSVLMYFLVFGFVPIWGILFSYYKIGYSILRIPS